ncbi:MAG: DUF4105 domain-containing protein, partial [Bdellovibrionota bacterium]|nr:DUF4105 domain-containing protein [Bdellovibrionota bacterium]
SKLISVAKPLLEIEVNDVNKSFCELLEQKSEILRRQNSSLIINYPTKATSICEDKYNKEVLKQVIFTYFDVYEQNQISEKLALGGCDGSLKPGNTKQRRPECIRLRKQNSRKLHISDDIVFSQLAKLHGRVANPDFNLRTLDIGEKQSNLMFAKHNFYTYLTDEEYKCKRPAINSFFERHFNHIPFPQKICSKNFVIIKDQGRNRTQEIPFDRLYRIDYLLASKGSSPMSWFGHSMYRLVICAPERKDPLTGKKIPATKMGPECLNDLSSHIVVNFAAYIGDVEIDLWKGITGGYMSTMYLSTLKDVKEKYNVVESRDLESFPLQLSKSQKRDFLNSLIETYWDYAGTYRFFSNNCASEAFFMLAGVIGDPNLSLQEPGTPAAVLDEFRRWNLVESSKNAPSINFVTKQKAADEIESDLLALNSFLKNQLKFYQKMSVWERKSYLLDFNENYLQNLDVNVSRSYYSLLLIYERKLQLEEYLEKASKLYSSFLKDLEARNFVHLNALKYPKTLLDSSYGIPSAEDLQSLVDKVSGIEDDSIFQEVKLDYKKREQELEQYRNLQRQNLKIIIINRKRLGGI